MYYRIIGIKIKVNISMNEKTLLPVFAAAVAGLSAAGLFGQPSSASDIKVERVSCKPVNGTPTTVVRYSEGGQTKEDPIPILYWKAEVLRKAGVLSPSQKTQALCEKASALLESAYSQNNGEVYFVTGKVDGKPSVCAETTLGSGCNRSNVLFSLEQNKNGDLSEVNKVLDGILDSRLNQGERQVIRGGTENRWDLSFDRIKRLWR